MEAVNIVKNTHIEGCGDSSLLLISANVEIRIAAAIGQLMNELRIAVIREQYGLILGKVHVIISIGQTVGMLRGRLQAHEVNHVDNADFQLRQVLAQNGHSTQHFESRSVAAASQNYIGLLPGIVRRPFPNADSLGAVLNRLLHCKPLMAGVL